MAAAFWLAAAGFVFTDFSVRYAGFDLLVDAVGWLLLFNACHALRRAARGFAFARLAALLLVGLCALQLVTTLPLAIPVAVSQVAFSLLLAFSLAGLSAPRTRALALAAWGVLGFRALVAVLAGLGYAPALLPPLAGALSVLLLGAFALRAGKGSR